MNNRRSRPLTIPQWKSLRETAQESGGFVQRLVADVVPFTALKRNQLAHLRDNWIQWQADGLKITIPGTADCNTWRSEGGDGLGPLTRRERPCQSCRIYGRTNRFESTFPGKDHQGPFPRSIILQNELAEPAVEQLRQIFRVRDRPEVAISPGTVSMAIHRLNESVPFERRFTNRSLMQTQVVIHAEYDLDFDALCDLSPYTEIGIRKILSKAPGVTHDIMRFDVSSLDFLEIVDNQAPVSAAELSSILDADQENTKGRLQNMAERDRVEVVGREGSHLSDQLWDVTSPPRENFYCRQEGCEYQTHSLNGIRQHESMTHNI